MSEWKNLSIGRWKWEFCQTGFPEKRWRLEITSTPGGLPTSMRITVRLFSFFLTFDLLLDWWYLKIHERPFLIVSLPKESVEGNTESVYANLFFLITSSLVCVRKLKLTFDRFFFGKLLVGILKFQCLIPLPYIYNPD